MESTGLCLKSNTTVLLLIKFRQFRMQSMIQSFNNQTEKIIPLFLEATVSGFLDSVCRDKVRGNLSISRGHSFPGMGRKSLFNNEEGTLWLSWTVICKIVSDKSTNILTLSVSPLPVDLYCDTPQYTVCNEYFHLHLFSTLKSCKRRLRFWRSLREVIYNKHSIRVYPNIRQTPLLIPKYIQTRGS